MPRALARHERIIADAAAARDGTVLKQKGEGDSTFAVFARVSDATAAALACQRALQCEDWPNGITLYLVALTSWRTAPDEALIALEECIAPIGSRPRCVAERWHWPPNYEPRRPMPKP